MYPDGTLPSAASTADSADPPAKLIESARGWHGIQLGVLGFIGFCGVLRMGEQSPSPDWLQWMATGGAVGAFVMALWSIVTVGKVAWPVDDPAAAPDPGHAGARLRSGVRTTIVSVALMAFAGLSAWWPTDGGASVEVSDANGVTACGVVTEGAPVGTMWLTTAEGETLPIRLAAVANVRPVSGC
jgi:hypothetical protein